MKIKRHVITSFLLMTVLFFLIYEVNRPPVPTAGTFNSKRFDFLLAQLSEEIQLLDSRSKEYRDIKNRILRISVKQRALKTGAENPGVLLEELNQLKTAFDGKIYSPNYKRIELEKARNSVFSLKKAGQQDGLNWIERGPGNVSGRARAVINDPNDPGANTWFVATVGGGIWKTNDGGNSWQHKSAELSTQSTMTLAMAPSNHDVLYAGTGMGYGRTIDLAGSGVWKSTDHGESWKQLPSTADGQLLAAVNRLVIDPQDENILLLCSNGDYTSMGPNGGNRVSGIFRTTDGGSSWTRVFDPQLHFGSGTDNRVQQIIANPQNFNTLYATVNEVGVIKSLDGGLNWAVSADYFALPRDIGSGEGSYRGISTRTEIAIAPNDTARLYAAVERPYGTADLYMSKNSGKNWVLVNDTGTDPNWFGSYGASGASGAYTSGWFNNSIAVHPFDKNTVFVGGVEIYRIDINDQNNTRNTTLIAAAGQRNFAVSYAHADHHYFEIIRLNASTGQFRIVEANDGGVSVSDDGGTNWRQITGMGTTQFYGVDKKPGSDVYIGGMQDNGTWHSPDNPNARAAWQRDLGGDGVEVAWNYANPDMILGGSQYGNLSRTTDGGQSWRSIPDAKAGAYAPFISKIANNKADPDLVFTVGSDGVKRSADFGQSWTLTPVANHWIGWRSFDNVEISLADPQVVWISSRLKYEPFIGKTGGIHVSVDGGLSFTDISGNLPDYLTEASGIGSHPLHPETAYLLFAAAGTPKIMRTMDLGQTWQDISGFDLGSRKSTNGFPDVAVYSLLVMPFDDKILWAGTEIGLFVSENNGISWHLAENGFPQVSIFQMTIVDDQVVVATQGRGIWSVNVPGLSGYQPPVPTLAPRFRNLVMQPDGLAAIDVELRSGYDSAFVRLDNEIIARFEPNSQPLDSVIYYLPPEPKFITLSINAFKDGRTFKSADRGLSVFPARAMDYYVSGFEESSAENDFTGNGFSIENLPGFRDAAIHSAHPYPHNSDLIYMLKTPIRVAPENAFLMYDDVCLVEEGTTADYRDPYFFDYVIVEATRDGSDWLPLIEGYDSRFNERWHDVYLSGLNGTADSRSNGDETLFVAHQLDLRQKFEAGDHIFIRFRLSSDLAARAWGWAIDNLRVQSSPALQFNPDEYALAQNFPNPFNNRTTISYNLPNENFVVLKIYDLLGREVSTLVNTRQDKGPYLKNWDGTAKNGRPLASGMYIYRIKAGAFSKSKKMILIR